MKVMFLKEVPANNARAGDVKEVVPGYARYLLREKLALVADDKIVAQVKERESATRRRTERQLTDARALQTKLKSLNMTVYAKTGDGGRLFGSVTNEQIAQQLKREAGVDIDKRKIEVEPPIKSLGPHEVVIKLHTEVTATVKVVVVAQ
jgi:large subunit ribosomal protein L9